MVVVGGREDEVKLIGTQDLNLPKNPLGKSRDFPHPTRANEEPPRVETNVPYIAKRPHARVAVGLLDATISQSRDYIFALARSPSVKNMLRLDLAGRRVR